MDSIKKKYQKTFDDVKETQKKKFKKIEEKKQDQQKNLPSIEVNKHFIDETVINYTPRTLSEKEKILLSKGLGFAMIPKEIDKYTLFLL